MALDESGHLFPSDRIRVAQEDTSQAILSDGTKQFAKELGVTFQMYLAHPGERNGFRLRIISEMTETRGTVLCEDLSRDTPLQVIKTIVTAAHTAFKKGIEFGIRSVLHQQYYDQCQRFGISNDLPVLESKR